VWAVSCGGHPTGPTTPPPDLVSPLTLTCPSDVRVENVDATTKDVTFPSPVATGGVAPITITCLPASGDSFPLGTSPVSCRAVDTAAPARVAACGFGVTLLRYVPVLPITKFLAFGDSITAGEINDDDDGRRCGERPASWEDLAQVRAIQPSLAYPAALGRLLTARYATQAFTVYNAGQPLDSTGDTARFSAVVSAQRPEAVLVMLGVIDVGGGFEVVPGIVANLDTDIREARRLGVTAIFLSTITPVLDQVRGCQLSNPVIRAANEAIRALAARSNVHLVDSYAAFVGKETLLIGEDGLHPNAAGHQVIADAFFAAIKQNVEPPPASTSLRIHPRQP